MLLKHAISTSVLKRGAIAKANLLLVVVLIVQIVELIVELIVQAKSRILTKSW